MTTDAVYGPEDTTPVGERVPSRAELAEQYRLLKGLYRQARARQDREACAGLSSELDRVQRALLAARE